ncbi:MAG: trypsin-like peptidase domain-containing protein [Bdellovibrionales bacterium]|nr:trypsin-like peptidase domain-containing protein [Bdellovibrionales bacterium]
MTKGFQVLLAVALAFAGPRALGYGEIKDYQLGSEWGKRRVFTSDLEGRSYGYVRAAQATVYLTVGATGFYLGKYNGVNVVATNHHVCPTAKDCVGTQAQFRLLGLKARVIDFLVTIKNVDLTLLAIQFSNAADEAKASRVARNFAFRQNAYQGEPLMTFGFGIANNPQNYLVGNEDSDCKIFSKTGDFRQTADPDKFNPVDYKAWSFVHGCDISHGDSGSALVDKRNGAIIGILWTGRFPKHKRVQDSSYLGKLYKAGSEEMWTELNYGIPATVIGSLLQDAMYSTSVRPDVKGVISALLSRS